MGGGNTISPPITASGMPRGEFKLGFCVSLFGLLFSVTARATPPFGGSAPASHQPEQQQQQQQRPAKRQAPSRRPQAPPDA